MEKKNVAEGFKYKIRNHFYSLCRNFNNFDNVTNDDIEYAKEIANSIKGRYDNYSRESIYFKYIAYIVENFYNVKNKDILPLILIMLVDPSFNIYKIYEKSSKMKDIKTKMKLIYGFVDTEIIKFEKAYILKFLNMDDFSFIKKLEM